MGLRVRWRQNVISKLADASGPRLTRAARVAPVRGGAFEEDDDNADTREMAPTTTAGAAGESASPEYAGTRLIVSQRAARRRKRVAGAGIAESLRARARSDALAASTPVAIHPTARA
jgi:hypothetical protein